MVGLLLLRRRSYAQDTIFLSLFGCYNANMKKKIFFSYFNIINTVKT